MRAELSRVIIKGGVLSPAELKHIAQTAEDMGLDAISFGSRQDIIFPKEVDEVKMREVKDLPLVHSESEFEENIISSYVSVDIFPHTDWLTSERYLYILERFNYSPKLKINLTDPRQRLVPLFNGHLNFIASEHEDYWYLYVRLPEWDNVYMYPVLIYSWELAKSAQEIENILQEEPENVETLFQLVSENAATNNRTIDKPLELPFELFPYYEGMHRVGIDQYWLGLYWRNNRYDLTFLKAMCDLCTECKIGKISITPWKSFIVKGIPMSTKLEWEKLLGKFGINVRHSQLELNWHIPVSDEDALELKQYLVTEFDKKDISTYGLTFGITDYDQIGYYFTSIVIQKNKPFDLGDGVTFRETYNLLYAENFNPHTRKYLTYVQEVDKAQLPSLLMEMSKMYFEKLGSFESVNPDKKKPIQGVEFEVHQCSECQTIYDSTYGDITQNIAPETSFDDLPSTYECPTCEALKSSFQKKVMVKEVSE